MCRHTKHQTLRSKAVEVFLPQKFASCVNQIRYQVPTLGLRMCDDNVYTQRAKKKEQSSPATRFGGAWGERSYSTYSFSTSALDRGEWSASRPGRALPPVKGPPVPIVQEAGWASEPVWTQRIEEKSFAPAGDRTSIARSSS
jgi:hypothetical protein